MGKVAAEKHGFYCYSECSVKERNNAFFPFYKAIEAMTLQKVKEAKKKAKAR
jgi:hypothetical protein